MTYYSYSPLTGEHTGKGQATESPLEADVYHIPAYATDLAPPKAGKRETPIWDMKSKQWIITPDYRGNIYWHTQTKERHEITELGQAPESTWTDKEPNDPDATWNGKEWEIPFGILKQRKISEIRSSADAALADVKRNFSGAEFESWSRQEAGAKALKQDPQSQIDDALFVINIAKGRGVEVSILVDKILGHVETYSAGLSALIGEQQRREDLVAKATTIQELNNI